MRRRRPTKVAGRALSYVRSPMRWIRPWILLALLSPAAAPAAGGERASLLSNGSFDADENADGWPDGWPRPEGASWPVEGGNCFLRLRPAKPGQTIVVYRSLPVDASHKAMELRYRVRYTSIKRGKEMWHDGRIILDFKGAAGKKLKPGPRHPNFTGSSDGWQSRSVRFHVPDGAKTLEVMPAMFQVAGGTLEIDDLHLVPIGPADVGKDAAKPKPKPKRPPAAPPAVPVRGKLPPPAELRVVGNRLRGADGNEVWLQGLSVPSLEWSPRGENVVRSIVTAVEVWKANVVRLPVKDDFWFGSGKGQKPGPEAAEAYRKTVDQAIEAAETRQAYLVLDLHGFRAPTERTVAFWQDAAGRYKDRAAVLFALFNEPHDLSWKVWRDGGELADKRAKPDVPAESAEPPKRRRTPGMQRLVEAVRKAGARNVVIAGGLDWGYDLSGVVEGFALAEPGGNGVMYDSHVYPWKRDWSKKVLAAARKHPILIGEVGCQVERMPFIPPEGHEDPYTWAPDMIAFIQAHRLSWTAWSFHPGASPCIIQDWRYTPTPYWGAFVKAALLGARFRSNRMR